MNSDRIEGTIKDYAGQAQAAVGDALGDTSTKVNGVVESIKGKAQDAYGKAQDAYGKARDKAKDLAEDAPEYLDRARETGKRYADTGKRYADRSVETVKTTVQEQPVATLLGGIAAGFLLGWLINSRKS